MKLEQCNDTGKFTLSEVSATQLSDLLGVLQFTNIPEEGILVQSQSPLQATSDAITNLTCDLIGTDVVQDILDGYRLKEDSDSGESYIGRLK